MATIRVRDWTKERIEEIREAESHSSHDSVIKALLKDRQLAQFAGVDARDAPEQAAPHEPRESGAPEDKYIDELTVLSELTYPENGILFLWCPNCENEVAHLTVDRPMTIGTFEVECQRCLTQLDQHALVAIDISYPIEERIVEGTLLDDLTACVVDYWDRALADLGAREPAVASDAEDLAWRIGQYAREFTWDWPADVPVVALEVGRTYRHEGTGDHIEVLEVVSETRAGIDSYRVRRSPEGASGDADTEVLDADRVYELVGTRSLVLAE